MYSFGCGCCCYCCCYQHTYMCPSLLLFSRTFSHKTVVLHSYFFPLHVHTFQPLFKLFLLQISSVFLFDVQVRSLRPSKRTLRVLFLCLCNWKFAISLFLQILFRYFFSIENLIKSNWSFFCHIATLLSLPETNFWKRKNNITIWQLYKCEK